MVFRCDVDVEEYRINFEDNADKSMLQAFADWMGG